MRIANEWSEFEVLDASNGEKLERWGERILVRPDPQVIWHTPKGPLWDKAGARYIRSETGGGHWENNIGAGKQAPILRDASLREREAGASGVMPVESESWTVSYKDLTFRISPTSFKHTGLFPEQAVNWDFCGEKIKAANRPVSVLNLFAYTGGVTLACATAGAQVCHVDASKGMVSWARENAALSKLSDKPVRWIIDDCKKFVEREIRRGNKYDGIIMDPPSYGRGPNGEVWKLEDAVYPLTELCAGLLSDDALFFVLNSYTTGLSASVTEYILGALIQKKRGGVLFSDEIGLPVTSTGFALPCGSTAIWAGSS